MPENYDRNVSHGVIVWFHAAGKGGKDADDMVKIWKDYCEEHHFILVGPKARRPRRLGGQRDRGGRAGRPRRTRPVHGGPHPRRRPRDGRRRADGLLPRVQRPRPGPRRGGQRGGARHAAEGHGLRASRSPFFVVAGQKDPLVKEITESKDRLIEKKFPVIYREIADFGKEYLDEKTFQELRAWMDSLDRI